MAGDRRREWDDKEAVRPDQAEHDAPGEGCGANAGGEEGAEAKRKMGQAAEFQAKIRFRITARRVRIDPEEKRSQYIARLEQLIAQLDRIIANPKTSAKNRLRAMDILIRAITSCYGIVSDVEVEILEKETEEVKTEGEGEKDLGYEIEPEEDEPPRGPC